MANTLHIKGSRNRVLNTFPTNNFGKDGDIVASRIKGRGTFLCIKAGGIWYSANQLQELRNVAKTSLKELKTRSLYISQLIKSNKDNDKFIVSDGGFLKYRTGEELLNDLETDALSINYKTAYCSLGQYNDKDTCELNGGTWYYSENDSHDSLNNTAENELLTIGSSIGKVDAESTLTYDGSTLEIKRNTDYDDNWQTSAQDNLLKLSYDSSNNTTVGVSSSGDLTITPSGGDTTLSSSTLTIGTIAEVGSDTDKILMSDSGVIKYVTGANLRSYIGAGTSSFGGALNDLSDVTYSSGDLTITSLDTIIATTLRLKLEDGEQGAFTLHSDDAGASQPSHLFGMELGSWSSIRLHERGGSSNADYFDIIVNEHGVTTLSTVDAAAAAANLTLDVDGDIILDANSGVTKFYLAGDTDDLCTLTVAANGATTMTTTDSDGTVGHLTLRPNGGLTLDPDSGIITVRGSTLFIEEQADANADAAGYGQLWMHDDTPNTFMFTDDAGQDIIVSKNTAVWGGYFPRATGQNGKWLGIPTGQLGAIISFGTDATAPDTSYTISTTADDMGAVIWQSIHGIRVTNCRIWYGQGGATNTGHVSCLMRYDIDTNGDLTNGVEVGGPDADLGSDDYTTLARTSLTMTSDVTVSNTQVLIAMVYCVNGINTAFTAKCILEYEDIP